MTIFWIVVIAFGGAVTVAAVTYTHGSRKKRQSIELGEDRKFRL